MTLYMRNIEGTQLGMGYSDEKIMVFNILGMYRAIVMTKSWFSILGMYRAIVMTKSWFSILGMEL